MRHSRLCLLWAFTLFLNVLSNNNSVAYELLYYYYVYKMEWEATPASSRTIATGCAPNGGRTGMCYFDEFADYVMNDAQFSDNYSPSSLTDHTASPTADSVTSINNAISRGGISSARYDLGHLSTALTGVTSMPDVLNHMLRAANDAINFGGVTQDSMEMAAEMSSAAKDARVPDITAGQYTALKAQFPDIVDNFLAFNDVFDWDTTFGEIDDAIANGDISANEGNAYKASLTGFTRTFGKPGYGYTVSDETHVAIQSGFTDTINQINQGINDLTAGTEALASLSECSSDEGSVSSSSSSSSSSSKRKRMALEYAGPRKRALAEVDFDFEGGLRGKRHQGMRLGVMSEL
ncbi:hypothetical protein BP5796_12958 [Coleophoma crateriformis]|uniref:Uncharacterized protein n=1 Tax=Coleophoma crateriformis TaxID=565419 RepID=A0A3D8Q4Y7_9HELO|nr:hypothetical protein BP5796_12958 [Coleophoma crateriformis]